MTSEAPSGAQLSLGGFAETTRTDRLFIGIFPDAPARAAIVEVVRQLLHEQGVRQKPLDPSRYHVTLHHLGDYPALDQERVDAARAAMARVLVPATSITLDHVTSFRGKQRHPWVLGCAPESPGVHTLWRALWPNLAGAGFTRHLQSGFTPHLTVLYGERRLSAPIAIAPIGWTIGEIVLVHSLLGKTEYRVLARQPLASVS
jgi:2'-5' RNA ligase